MGPQRAIDTLNEAPPHRAISSAKGQIRHLLIAFDGKQRSYDFVRDILRTFPPRIEILVWIGQQRFEDSIHHVAKRVGRTNYRIILNNANDSQLTPDTKVLKESMWLRDPFYTASNGNDKDIKLYTSKRSDITNALIKAKVISDCICNGDLPDFGDILIDDEHIFIGYGDIGPQDTMFGMNENRLMHTLFPEPSGAPKLIKLGYQLEGLADLMRSKTKFDLLDYFVHTDTFLTLTGIRLANAPVVLLGRPELLGDDPELEKHVMKVCRLFDHIARQLTMQGIIVLRNPIPVFRLNTGVPWVGYFNNGIVETVDTDAGQERNVWLPGFKFRKNKGRFVYRAALRNRAIWESLDFNIHFVKGGMRAFSSGSARVGALRCLTVDIRL